MLTKLAYHITAAALTKLADAHRTIKLGLNAQSARALAKSVGVIPHYKSDWKWALRQMRAPNPTGTPNAPLMQSGKELAKTKLHLGKLPNNEFQKLKSENRRLGGNKEIAFTDRDDRNAKLMWDTGLTGDPDFIRESDRAAAFLPNFSLSSGTNEKVHINPLRRMVGHTHPSEGKITYLKEFLEDELSALAANKRKQSIMRDRERWVKRLMDSANNPADFIREYGNVSEEVFPAIIKEKMLSGALGSAQAGINLSLPEIDKLRLMRVAALDELNRATKKIEIGRSTVAKRQGNYDESGRLLDSTLAASPSEGDMMAIRLFPNRRDRHVIVSPKSQGVHAVRVGRPGGLRSVYFDGGLD